MDSSDRLIGSYALKVHRKNIKHIYFRIYPTKKIVVVSSPHQVGADDLNQIISSKLDWIRQQIKKAGSYKKEPFCNFISQEKIFFQGKPFSIKFAEATGKTAVFIHEDSLILKIQSGSHNDQKTKKIDQWLRRELHCQIVALVEKWEPVLGVYVKDVRVRKMKTRWGSCNIRARRIWLNQVLVHLSPCYLEYVVVHEMVHLLERKHNARFKKYMDLFIPTWRLLKRKLKEVVL